jgi:hypothetical protein
MSSSRFSRHAARYKLARTGKLPNLTGVGTPPEHVEPVLAGAAKSPAELAQEVLATLDLPRRGPLE